MKRAMDSTRYAGGSALSQGVCAMLRGQRWALDKLSLEAFTVSLSSEEEPGPVWEKLASHPSDPLHLFA